ncbi:very-long-chain (3R)-3-hydroxyacyl-CoA dehydratase-like [Oncorhynchus keta]|uniref:very-long-chain (3R)-3-hydroxyacyl-CoA dehydratase-like n=1 Tax=Oncorhynchus keta TaxID=8018 RepID=UPI00227CA558|nr:very-long-chain (3R)-3-hydroxyacyl-CoA dehydratase-like [Oncorhynchus keta]
MADRQEPSSAMRCHFSPNENPFLPQVSILHAGLYRHRVEDDHLAEVHRLDTPVPSGVLAEAVAVVQSISVFDQSRLFSIPLPEALGSSASFSCVLYIYLPLMVIGLLINFRHLYKQRLKRFRTKKRKSN